MINEKILRYRIVERLGGGMDEERSDSLLRQPALCIMSWVEELFRPQRRSAAETI